MDIKEQNVVVPNTTPGHYFTTSFFNSSVEKATLADFSTGFTPFNDKMAHMLTPYMFSKGLAPSGTSRTQFF